MKLNLYAANDVHRRFDNFITTSLLQLDKQYTILLTDVTI